MSWAKLRQWQVPSAVKQRIFFGALIVLTIWPLAHYALVRAYGINHWRFAGFAMYTRPGSIPKLGFSGRLHDGSPLTPARLKAALGKDAARIDEFVQRRKLWGDLASPESVGKLLFERLPELDKLTIVINTVTLGPLADYASYTSDYYDCTRPGRRGSRSCTQR